MTAPSLPPSAVALTPHTPGVYVESQVGTHLALPRAEMERLLAERDALRVALECEDAYSHARSSDEWMAVLTAAGWNGASNPRPFINALRRRALAPEGGSDAK